ncbi:hypothetical protein [Gallaecimonas mangrovi]|uniref:hypothetical protein n=1 Tax=Gallaecimonas mangrovi TaxID=2291597 RepID=UPI000E200EB1|nr:hypothetical protein [Gallaecimonas mangrovi]
MKKALCVLALLLCSCAQTPNKANQPQFDAVVTQDQLDNSPVKSPVLHRVQSIAIADLSAFLVNTPLENQRLYDAMVKETTALLADDTRYRLVGPAMFAKQLRDMKVSLDLGSMSEDEINQILAKAGYALGVHAVVVVNLKDGDQDTHWLQVPQQAKVTAAMTLLRTRIYMPLWQQREAIAWNDSNHGLAEVAQDNLDSEVKTVLQPLVQAFRHDYQN